MEGTVASIPPQGGRKHPQQEFLNVNTSNILFICGGAFSGLEKIIAKRGVETGIGFSANVNVSDTRKFSDLLSDVEPEDLLKFGLIPEFIGRLPILASLDDLDEKALVEILTVPRNALIKQYKKIYDLENVKLTFTKEALATVAKKAISRKTGARGLRSILEEILLDSMYEIPSDSNINEVVLNEDVVLGKSKPIVAYAKNKKEIETSA